MKQNYLNSQQQNVSLNFKFLSFIMLIALFFSCKSENLDEYKADQFKSIQPISVDDARKAFEGKYGKKLVIKETIPSLVSGGDTSELTIEPIWTEARIAAYLKTTPILLVPIENVATLDKAKSGYSLVFFRDSLGAIKQRLQVFRADDTYKANNPRYSVNNFSGVFFQINMDGTSQNAYKLRNGKFVSQFVESGTKLDKREDCPDPSSCPTWGQSWWSKFVSVLAAVFAGDGGNHGGYITISIGNNNNAELLNFGSDLSPYTNGSSVPQRVFSNNLADELGNEIFEMTDERADLLEIHNKLILDYGETQFLRSQPSVVAQMITFLRTGSLPAAVRPSLARIHLELLISDFAYKQKNAQTGFGSSIFGVLNNYLLADFEPLVFARLYTNPTLLGQVNRFLNKHSINGVFQNDVYAIIAKNHSSSYLDDANYRQTVDQYNQLASGGGSPFSSIMTEIAKVVLKKILKKAIPEWDIADELIDASAHFATGEYLDLIGDCVTIGTDLAKASSKVVSPWVLTAIALVEGTPIVKKGLDLYDRFDAIYNQLSSQVFNGVFKAFSTFKFSNNKDWFDSIENVLENGVEKNLKFNGSLQSFFNHLKNQFPGASTGTYRNSPYIQVGNVFIRFYTESATSGTPTISFTVNDVKPIQDGGTGIIIIKFRQP